MPRKSFSIIILLLIIILWGFFAYQRYSLPQQATQNIEKKYYLFYTGSTWRVEQYELPAPASGSVDGNIYLWVTDGILGIKVDPISGNIEELRDELDIVQTLDEIVPPDDWDIYSSASPMIHRMHALLITHESGKSTFVDRDRSILLKLFFPVPASSDSAELEFNRCITDPYGLIDVSLLTPEGKDICKEPVPRDLVFTQHEQDVRYKRFRYAVFYNAYTSRDIKSCEPLLRTSFLYDNEHDPIVSQSQNYLLCESLIARDSNAIRNMSFRFGHITYEGRCELYTNSEIQSRCKKIVSLNAQQKANVQN